MSVIEPWEGFLSFENMDRVARRILALLDGKKFAIAIVNHNSGPMPVLHTSMRLVGEKVVANKGNPAQWQCYIRIYAAGGVLSLEEAWYLRGEYEPGPYFDFGFDCFTIRDTRTAEYINIAIQP